MAIGVGRVGESVIVTIKMFSLDLDFCLKQAYNKRKNINKGDIIMKTRSQRRDYLEKKRDMLNRMCDITDSVANYVDKYNGTNMAQLIIEVYFGRPFHVPLDKCVFPGTNEIDWDRAEENLNIMRNKLLFIRELCK